MATTDPATSNVVKTEETWHGALKETINIPADKAWPITGNFCTLNKWVKTMEKFGKMEGEYQHLDCVGYMAGSSLFPRTDGKKSWAKEKLFSMDEKNYIFSYQMLDNNFGLDGYQQFKLRDPGNGTTAVDKDVYGGKNI